MASTRKIQILPHFERQRAGFGQDDDAPPRLSVSEFFAGHFCFGQSAAIDMGEIAPCRLS